MVNYCSVYNCKNNTSKNPKLSFFIIPADKVRQRLWLPKIGRPEWIHKNPDSLRKRRVCGEHFTREMICRSRLKSDAFPCIFMEGVGEKGVNVNASTSASSPSVDIEIMETEDMPCEDHNIPIIDSTPGIDSTPERKSGETQTSPKLSSSTPRKKRLISEVKNLRKKITTIAEKEPEDLGDEEFIRYCRKNFNSVMAEFMISQLKLHRTNPHGHRYSLAFRKFALTIYFLGPKVYKFLQKTSFLPHKATLSRMTTNWDFSAGLNHYIFQVISLKIANLESAARDCIICVDKMSIKTHLFYNRSLDRIIGFHQCNGNRSFEPANCALVIMARGVQHNWKQPVAYFFVHNSCDVKYLHEIIIMSIRKLTHIGLNVLALISDQGPNFYKFSNEIGANVQKPYFHGDEK